MISKNWTLKKRSKNNAIGEFITPFIFGGILKYISLLYKCEGCSED